MGKELQFLTYLINKYLGHVYLIQIYLFLFLIIAKVKIYSSVMYLTNLTAKLNSWEIQNKWL